jgi:4'-phosphopantetheinyl transferase
MEPDQLRFIYCRYGKPGLEIQSEEETVNFNMSHSSGLAFYAVTRNQKIGIDIERIIDDFQCEEVARNFFSLRENKELLEIEAGRPREHAFFSCWTRKEAYIKARGGGLSIPLDQFDVSVSPFEPAKLFCNRQHPKEISRWSLLQILPASGFIAALAVDGHDWQAKYWDLPNQ